MTDSAAPPRAGAPDPLVTPGASGGNGRLVTAAEGPANTSSRGTRVLGVASAVSVVALVAYAFGISKPDTELGETVRILYLHVPTVSIAYLWLIVNAVASAVFLFRRGRFADQLAASTGEVGTILLGLTLVTGMFWGRPTWGTYWEWDDPRLTSVLLMFLMYLGYNTVRSLSGTFEQRGVRSAVVGVVSAFMIVPVKMSTEWWSSLHQDRTVFAPGDSKIHGAQEFSLYLGFVAFLLLATWITVHRFRVGWLADEAASDDLDLRLAERRAEAADADPASAPESPKGAPR
ncbi:MAG: cytochrome c biogenesis protein CcsA [Microthrixaceae bacterium]